MPVDTIDQTISALYDAGATDDEITGILKEKFGAKPGIVSRTASGIWANANPIAMIKGVADAVMHPVDTYNGLVDKSAENFTEAKDLLKKGEYGHAIHHGIAAVVPPYNIVTHAGDEMRKGNVAGGVGEAIGAGLSVRAPQAVIKGAPAALRVANRATVAGANFLESNPAAAATVGAGVGYMHGGVPGALEGAMGGGLVPRLLKAARQMGKAEEAPKPTLPSRLVKSPVSSGNSLQSILDDMRKPPSAESVSLPPETSLSPGYEDQIRQMGQRAEGKIAPAETSPPLLAVPDLPFKLNKVDIARITALDKELGAEQTARALRHDPRFVTMSAAERVQAVRTISQEVPGALPAKGVAAIDAKFNAINPLMRAQYVETWKTVNPAVYAYLRGKL